MRYAMMIELDKCIGCQACVTSCKERWDSGPGAARDWVFSYSRGSRQEGDLNLTFYPGLCMHCQDHPCTRDCPTGATYQDKSGIVMVDADVCIGCGNCIPACPYGARHADARKGIVEKCNFCAPYVARGEAPACVQTCLADCRHFGDLDNAADDLRNQIAKRKAKPLFTNEIDVGPQVYYAPEQQRTQVLTQSVVRRYHSTLFTGAYTGVTKPLARWLVAPVIVATGMAGIALNLRGRLLNRHPKDNTKPAEVEPAAPELVTRSTEENALPRHRAGMRFLHWFNLLSWILLLSSGTALMSTTQFALFGDAIPRWFSELVGGQDNLIWLHAAWGVFWSLIIIPLFIYFKHGGIEALREVWISFDDLKWLLVKPLVLLGIKDRQHLPPQDKYNSGQKLFALSALGGTALIIITGVIMTFHLGSAEVVRTAILLHKIAIMLALVGIAVHVTMAAILVEERPALWSMIVGQIDREHAAHHSTKWVQEIEGESEDSTTENTE